MFGQLESATIVPITNRWRQSPPKVEIQPPNCNTWNSDSCIACWDSCLQVHLVCLNMELIYGLEGGIETTSLTKLASVKHTSNKTFWNTGLNCQLNVMLCFKGNNCFIWKENLNLFEFNQELNYFSNIWSQISRLVIRRYYEADSLIFWQRGSWEETFGYCFR